MAADPAAPAELRAHLDRLGADIAAVDARAANTRAGYVYVISNIGSFGDQVVKIGMTRRLEPMDRVRELGDASVPLRFDDHALVFSDDPAAWKAASMLRSPTGRSTRSTSIASSSAPHPARSAACSPTPPEATYSSSPRPSKPSSGAPAARPPPSLPRLPRPRHHRFLPRTPRTPQRAERHRHAGASGDVPRSARATRRRAALAAPASGDR
jgi:T5orf172 domain